MLDQERGLRFVSLVCVCAGLCSSSAYAAGIELQATNATTGAVPPLLFGYNTLDLGANGADWLHCSHANTLRYRIKASHITPLPASMQSIGLSTFVGGNPPGLRQQIVDDLLADPGSFDQRGAQRHVDWNQVRCAYSGQLGDPSRRECFAEIVTPHYDSELSQIIAGTRTNGTPMSVLALIDSSSANAQGQVLYLQTNSAAADYYWTRWWVWRAYFVQAYYLARAYGIVNHEFVNEPENDGMGSDEVLERATLAGDAIQRAIWTVNQWRATKSLPPLVPNVMAAANTGWRTDTLDLLIAHYVPTEFYGRSIATAWAFPPPPNSAQRVRYNSLSYHRYSDSIPMLTWCEPTTPCAKPAALNNVYLTELNTANGGLADSQGWTANTQDRVDKATLMGRMLSTVGTKGYAGAYIMQFGVGALNATHWQDSASGQVGGAKRTGDVVRMYAEGFGGAVIRKNFVPKDDLFAFDAGYDSTRKRYAIWSVNTYPTSYGPSVPLIVDLAGWGIAPGSQVMVKEVSAARRGEVRRYYTVDGNRRISFAQPTQSTVLMMIPDMGARAVTQIGAKADAYVRAGSLASGNFGTGGSLYAYSRASGASASDRRVSYIKMQVPTSGIEMAVLRVTAQSGLTEIIGQGQGEAVAHVYGVDYDGWAEDQIKWKIAPGLGPSTVDVGDVVSFSQNFLKARGTENHILGAITGNSDAPTDERVDVTDYVRAQTDGWATFMIIREVRFDEDSDGTAGDSVATNASMWIASRGHVTESFKPVLEVVQR